MVKVEASKNRARIVSCEGKQKHETAEKAEKHRIHMLRQGKKDYHVYKCKYCEMFHVGRESKKK